MWSVALIQGLVNVGARLSFKPSTVGSGDSRFKDLNNEAESLTLQLSECKNEEKAILEKIEASRKGRIRADLVTRGVTLLMGSVWQVVSDDTMDIFLQAPPEGDT